MVVEQLPAQHYGYVTVVRDGVGLENGPLWSVEHRHLAHGVLGQEFRRLVAFSVDEERSAACVSGVRGGDCFPTGNRVGYPISTGISSSAIPTYCAAILAL